MCAVTCTISSLRNFRPMLQGRKAGGRLQTIGSLQHGLIRALELLGLHAHNVGAVLMEMRQRALHR